jgi:hypothetical protein
MRVTPHFLRSTGLRGTRRCRYASRLASHRLGSWPVLGAVLVLIAVAAALVGRAGRGGDVAVLGLIMPGLALAAVSLVLMAVRRADRAADLWAMRHLAAARRIEASGHEIFSELNHINAGLARLAARIEMVRLRCQVSPEADDDEPNPMT